MASVTTNDGPKNIKSEFEEIEFVEIHHEHHTWIGLIPYPTGKRVVCQVIKWTGQEKGQPASWYRTTMYAETLTAKQHRAIADFIDILTATFINTEGQST